MAHGSFVQILEVFEDHNPCECMEKERMALDHMITEGLVAVRVVCMARHHMEEHGLAELQKDEQIHSRQSSRMTEVEDVWREPMAAVVDQMWPPKG
jgi:hypothetical protein